MHWSEAGFLENNNNLEAQIPNKNMSEKTTRLYELGFLLTPTIPEVEVSNKVENLKSLVVGLEGEVTKEMFPEYIDLAYTIEKTLGSKKSKYSQAYFGFIKFNIEPAKLDALKKVLDNDIEIIRYIIIKTSEANTISFKKPKMEAKRELGLVDEEAIDETEEVEEIIDAHEALPDLMPEIEAVEEANKEEL
jgi:ribosomal protein S6